MDNSNINPSKGGWKSAIFIIFVEMAERFAYYGIAGNLIMYLTTMMDIPLATAAKNVNSWNGVSSLALFIGAFFADSYLGRFKTTLLSSSVFLMGLILLTISTTTKIPLNIRTPLFFSALYITALGEGGHKPCVQTFAADQFDENTPEQRKAKSSFFNWWYLGIVVGATIAVVVIVYVEDNVSWTVGFSIPTIAVGLALAVFIFGCSTYRMERPVGSPFTRVAQVVVAATRKRHVVETSNGRGLCYDDDVGRGLDARKLARTNQFRCLDKAMTIDERDSLIKSRNPWRLCSVNQVEEVKLIVRLIPIWVCTFAYAIIVAQVHTFFIKQASTMQRSLGPKVSIPPASLQVIPGITILISVPIYDKLFVPSMRNITKIPSGISSLHRIGIGLGLSILTIAIAALVENMRVGVASKHGLINDPKAIVPMSVGWLVPQFVVMGLSDMFAYVGMQELFYDQMPEDMRSMGSALTNGAIGVGAFMSSAIIAAVQQMSKKWGEEWLVNNLNRAHLDEFYWVLAGFCALDLVIYVLAAKWFVWKNTAEVDQIVIC
ncbi:protein NRT1/ PTR FAMILY 5.4-like [Chenopodium quinoa]|uniref:protein NRT1/ PTR FAMILY 5.4-like n=1 Tax=Chenopodium quinoa TaxID=63459 RepID=UPI000B7780E5|nr:protein NRT1/ PTR FAMILY 5.4-like [Chenopodium quinoa]